MATTPRRSVAVCRPRWLPRCTVRSLQTCFLIPFKSKLEDRDKDESRVKEIVIEGILSIQSGDNPRILLEKLVSFLAAGTETGGTSGEWRRLRPECNLWQQTKKVQEMPPEGAPDYMLTYGDMVTLLLTFFVMLLTTATVDGHELRLILAAFPGLGPGRWQHA